MSTAYTVNKQYKYFIGLIIVAVSAFGSRATAQDAAILLVISNQEVKVLLDGVEKEQPKPTRPFG